MSVILDDEFACSVSDYWDRVFLTEDYQRRLHLEALGFRSYRCLEHRESPPGEVFRSIEVAGVPGLPGLVQKLVPGGGYVETGRLNRAENQWRFHIEPAGLGGRIRISGEVQLTELDSQRCRRRGEIVVTVRIAAVGGRVTKSLISLTEDNERKSAAFTHRFIDAL